MAKITFGSFLTDIRGRLRNDIFSRNLGGAYVKNFTNPSNPQTSRQITVRTYMFDLVSAWAGLTEGQRQAWNDATVNFPRENKTTGRYYLSGLSLYLSLNIALLNIGESANNDPPAPETVEGIESFSFVADNSANTLSVTFSPDPVPADTAYNVYATVSLSPTINYVQNRLFWIGFIDAAATSPADLSSEYNSKYGPIGPVGEKITLLLVPINKTTGQLGSGLRSDSIIIA